MGNNKVCRGFSDPDKDQAMPGTGESGHGISESDAIDEIKRQVQSRIDQESDAIDEMRQQVKDRVAQVADDIKPDPDNKDAEITSEFISDCIFANALGDGTMFATLHRNQYLYIKNQQEWCEWNISHWQRDVMGRALAAVEAVVQQYLGEYKKISATAADLVGKGEDSNDDLKKIRHKQKDLLKRVSQLRDDKRRTTVLKFAHTIENPLAIKGDEFDQKPMLFPCANGVINLETGKLKPGRPGDYLSLSSPIEFRRIDEPAALFEKSVLEIFSGDEEMVAYIQRLFGYGMTGHVYEKVFPVLHGRTGWNGRSLLVETINHVMGSLGGPIPSEMLLSSRHGSSATSPSADIMRLKGLRMAFASETDEGQRFSASRVKWLTGKDQLVGRSPYDRYLSTFQPTHKLFLMTNTKPQAPPNDRAFWERLHLIPFLISFVNRNPQEAHERRAILDLDRQLLKEAPGILAWLVRGCLLWQKHGLNPPRKVTEATEQYRKDEDLLADFIDECCIIEPGARCKSSTLYGEFITWYHANIGVKEPSGHWFGKQLSQKCEKVKSNGVIVYCGIDLAGGQN